MKLKDYLLTEATEKAKPKSIVWSAWVHFQSVSGATRVPAYSETISVQGDVISVTLWAKEYIKKNKDVTDIGLYVGDKGTGAWLLNVNRHDVVLNPKTAAEVLSSIFGKLGVKTRMGISDKL